MRPYQQFIHDLAKDPTLELPEWTVERLERIHRMVSKGHEFIPNAELREQLPLMLEQLIEKKKNGESDVSTG